MSADTPPAVGPPGPRPADLEAELARCRAAVRDTHHRVKNDLQLVASLLHLQSVHLADPAGRAALQNAQARVRTLALVHDAIHRSADPMRVDLAAHLEGLVHQLVRAHGADPARVRPVVRVSAVAIDRDRAVSLTLLVHELVANALRHAFPAGRAGTLTVAADSDEGGRLTLTVADDGVGFPPGLDFRKTATLGLQLVCSLTQQLGGTIDLDRAAGTAFRVTLPAPRLPSTAP